MDKTLFFVKQKQFKIILFNCMQKCPLYHEAYNKPTPYRLQYYCRKKLKQFSIAIRRPTGDKWQSKTLVLENLIHIPQLKEQFTIVDFPVWKQNKIFYRIGKNIFFLARFGIDLATNSVIPMNSPDMWQFKTLIVSTNLDLRSLD